jgi:hypothetical protein
VTRSYRLRHQFIAGSVDALEGCLFQATHTIARTYPFVGMKLFCQPKPGPSQFAFGEAGPEPEQFARSDAVRRKTRPLVLRGKFDAPTSVERRS